MGITFPSIAAGGTISGPLTVAGSFHIDSLASLTGLGMPVYRSGSYYTSLIGGDSTQTPVNNTQYATPFPIRQANFPGIDRIGLEVITAGQSGSTIRLGAIADDSVAGWFPKGAVIFDTVVNYSASINGASQTRQEITINELIGYRGLVWLTLMVQNAPITQPAIKMTSGYTQGHGGKLSDLTNLFTGGYKNEQTDTAIAPFIEPPSSTRGAKIFVRIK